MESIIQREPYCYFCGAESPLHVHHCLHGTANRRLADEDGLTVYLCPSCHSRLHDQGLGDRHLQIVAETEWIKHYADDETGIEKFIERYGKNYI